MRLDQYLVANGFFESRNKAATAVKNGVIRVNGAVVLKPSTVLEDASMVSVQSNVKTYVARSANKLLKAFRVFSLDWNGKVAADLGASTGGFCQVLLENGIKKIYAVDIGTQQLHSSLLENPSIINMEHTNARYLEAGSFPESVDCITADLSFISILLILPSVFRVLSEDGEAVLLIKPQFEAGKQCLSKSGVVTDRKVHKRVIADAVSAAENLGFGVKGISFSGLAGESGNREYLLYLKKGEITSIDIECTIQQAVYEED